MNVVEATTRQVQPNANSQTANFLPTPGQVQGNTPPIGQYIPTISGALPTAEISNVQRTAANVVVGGTKPQGLSRDGAKTLSTLPEAITVTFNPEKKPGDLSSKLETEGVFSATLMTSWKISTPII